MHLSVFPIGNRQTRPLLTSRLRVARRSKLWNCRDQGLQEYDNRRQHAHDVRHGLPTLTFPGCWRRVYDTPHPVDAIWHCLLPA